MSTLVKRNNLRPSTSFFDDFFTRDLFDFPFWSNETGSVPRVNITETNDDFKVYMAAPGMKKDDFHIELDNGTLTIHSEVQDSDEREGQKYTRQEFSYQSFSRSFYLPNIIETDKIKAKYTDGILSLVIPKKEEAKRKPVKTIEIK